MQKRNVRMIILSKDIQIESCNLCHIGFDDKRMQVFSSRKPFFNEIKYK